MPRPLPPCLPPAPVDDRLVAAVANETSIPPVVVRGWLEGSRRLVGEHQRAALESLWRPIGGVNGSLPVRRAERPAQSILARKGAA
jgi:hypothetical protein